MSIKLDNARRPLRFCTLCSPTWPYPDDDQRHQALLCVADGPTAGRQDPGRTNATPVTCVDAFDSGLVRLKSRVGHRNVAFAPSGAQRWPETARLPAVPGVLDLRNLESPIVQAGMGGIARHELAAAVSEAGGLGTVAGVRARIAAELAAARRLTGKPIAVNLLLPFVRTDDVEAAAAAEVIVTFWGKPRRLAPNTWIHQCGSVQEAKSAAAGGAEAVIVQGVEAGGHVRGTIPMLDLLERVRSAVKIPVLAAGGIVDAEGVRAALDAGAAAAVVGTRFLLSAESHAHPAYQQRCLAATETVLTELFGLGWPDAPHRVIPNAATRRWLRSDPRGPEWIRSANRLTAPLANRIPAAIQGRAFNAQRPWQPFLGPQPPTDDGPVNLVDSGPLYAGMNVSRMTDVLPAAELVKALTP